MSKWYLETVISDALKKDGKRKTESFIIPSFLDHSLPKFNNKGPFIHSVQFNPIMIYAKDKRLSCLSLVFVILTHIITAVVRKLLRIKQQPKTE